MNPDSPHFSNSRRAFVRKSLAASLIAAQPTLLSGLVCAQGVGETTETTEGWDTTSVPDTGGWSTQPDTTVPIETTVPFETTMKLPWKIRVDAVGRNFSTPPSSADVPEDVSSGAQEAWMDGVVNKVVRRCLELRYWAKEDPQSAGRKDYAETATSNIKIQVREWAQIKNFPNEGWVRMTQDQWDRFTGNAIVNDHSTSAWIAKSIDPQRGEIMTLQDVNGDGDETENNIRITLEWNGDALTVGWARISPSVTYESTVITPHFEWDRK